MFKKYLAHILLMALFALGFVINSQISVFAQDSEDSSEDDSTDEDEDDSTDEDEDDSTDEDEDDSTDEDEDDMADAMDAISDANEKIAEAELVIAEKEADGYEVTAALERLSQAKSLLLEAEAAFTAADYEQAEELAEDAKYAAMYSKGKDIESTSEGAEIGEEFGICISEASNEDSDSLVESFNDCFEKLSEDVSAYVEKLLSEEDQALNLALTGSLQSLATELDGKLQELILDFSEFTFSGLEEEEVISAIEDVLNSDESEEEKEESLEDLIDEFKEESTLNKFEDGVIPFQDTDDEEWYFDFVNHAAELGCVTGFKDADGNSLGEFRPSNPILFGEGSKLVVECILGEMPSETAEEDHWAKGYGLTIVEEFSSLLSPELLEKFESALEDEAEFNEGFTRGELIELVVDVLALEVPEATEPPFADVPLTHPNVDAINFALDYGVITGDSVDGSFRPDEVANRAEIIKIIILAKELF